MRKALALLALLLAGCDDTPGKWSAFVYPDGHDRSKWERTDRFKSLGMCRRAALESIAKLPKPAQAAYRCVQLEPV